MVEVFEASASAAAALRVRLGGMTIVVTMQCNCTYSTANSKFGRKFELDVFFKPNSSQTIECKLLPPLK
jgi:hypothetical protein